MNLHSPGETYGRAALDRECEELARTAHGRNDRLNRAAFSLGQLVGAGLLTDDEVERRLLNAATTNGYIAKDGLASTRATIRSGLAKGALEPRTDLPDLSSRHAPVLVGDGARRPCAPPWPVLSLRDVPLPDWTPPDEDGKPYFTAPGASQPTPVKGEVRRHIYVRDGEPVRVKVKRGPRNWLDFYRVRRPSDSVIGWQAKRPAAYVQVPYIGPSGALDPFDPEHLDEPLFWPEGEKDVDTLRQHGCMAFTFGGSNDVPQHVAELIAGRELVILGDNDEPGRKCVERKIELALRSGAQVRVDRFSDLPDGKDVSDWFQTAGGSVEALLERAKPVSTPSAGHPQNQMFYRPRPHLSESSIRRWIGVEPAETRFVVDRIIPRGMATLLAGDGGAGKTLLTQLALTCSAAGTDFLGLKVEQGAVAGIFGEDPDAVMHSRQLRICRALNLDLESLEPRLRIESFLGTDLALWRKGGPTNFFKELEDDLAQIPDLSLVAIDSASLVFAGNENDRGEVATFMALLNGLASRLNAAVVLQSHTSKTQSDAASGMASGSTAWVWQARSALRLKNNDKGMPELHHPKANHAKKLDPIKLKWSDDGVLVLDPDAAAEGPKGKGVRLNAKAKIGLKTLRDALLDHGEPAPTSLQLPYGLRVVLYEHWRERIAKHLVEPGEVAKVTTVRQQIKRVLDDLVSKEIVGRDDPYLWIAREPST